MFDSMVILITNTVMILTHKDLEIIMSQCDIGDNKPFLWYFSVFKELSAHCILCGC
jgi:hypothetical protein